MPALVDTWREIQRSWRAMNTDVTALIHVPATDADAGSAALASVEQRFEKVEAALSRFRDTSELSALNRANGAPFRASPLLLAVMDAALAAAASTDGAFDPTILPQLLAAGYDRSFEALGAALGAGDSSARPTRRAATRPSPALFHGAEGARWTWRDVRLDPQAGTITLPPGCAIDLGGIGKGWTVDRAAEQLAPFGNFAIDAGGDMYVGGTDLDGRPWTVGVEDPRDPSRDLLVLALRDRAVATSTTARRRWTRHGALQHHLIDPRTGRPSASGVLSATVIASSTAQAEVLAKAALIRGPDAGLALIERQPGVAGMLVLADGTQAHSHDFAEYIDAVLE